jgi:hypothetical protein
VGLDYNLRIDEDGVIDAGRTLTLRNDAGASIRLTESGHVVICDAFGHCLNLSGGDGITWDLNNDALSFVNAADVTIEGQSVLVIGSKDTDNDTNITRGY